MTNAVVKGTGRSRVVCSSEQHLIGDGMARELDMPKRLDPMSLELVTFKINSVYIWFSLSECLQVVTELMLLVIINMYNFS